jgi:predicted nucleotidyltransferase
MRTNVIYFALASENRKKIVKTILDYPKRQWSCSALEDLTKVSHATVFRALKGLTLFGVLKSFKINKKDLLYELTESPMVQELNRIVNIERITVDKIVNKFINRIKAEQIQSVILYGSSVRGNLMPESDIDLLIILDKHNKNLEEKILNEAAKISSQANKTISPVIMDVNGINKEKNSQFIRSVKENMELIYGKKPF